MRSIVLAVLVFVCGWAVMSLEMLGGMILTPFFGSDIYVWGSVIGVFLMSLAIGYLVGGKLSRRFPRPGLLSGVIVVAAVSIAILPLFYGKVNAAIFDEWVAESEAGERWACLVAAAALFLIPTTLLGMVSPYAVQLAARELSSVGERAGKLYAISTIGSVLGCLMTSFYFILWWHIDSILLLTAGLAMLAVLSFAGPNMTDWRDRLLLLPPAALVLASLVLARLFARLFPRNWDSVLVSLAPIWRILPLVAAGLLVLVVLVFAALYPESSCRLKG
jgi:MFS family permease